MIRNDERGVTAPLEYVYTIALATILVTGLIIAATNAAGDQRRQTTVAQMEVVAQQVAGNLEAADRIVQNSESVNELTLERELPEQVVGGEYLIEIDSGRNPTITITSTISENTIDATADLETPINENQQAINGGDVIVEYYASNTTMEMKND